MNDVLRLPDAVQSIPEALAFWAEATPEAPGIVVHEGTTTTYARLWQDAQILAASLQRRGIGRGDRVVLLIPEGPLLAQALLGTACAAIAMPLSSKLTSTELGSALAGLHATAAIMASPLPAPVEELLSHTGTEVLKLSTDDGLPALKGGSVGVTVSTGLPLPASEDVAVVSQSSGTTGKPKRVPYSHGGLMISGREHRDAYGLNRLDRGVAASPVTVSLGTSTLLQSIVIGSALIFPKALDPDCVWGAMRAERPTWMQASSGFLELLVRYLRSRPASESVSLRFVRATSAAISPVVCEELSRRLGCPILPSYSSSEAGCISMTFPPPAGNKSGAVGRPVLALAIVDERGIEVGASVMGEIWFHAPRVFAGYLDDPVATAAAFAPGHWFRTGDIGYLDEDGFLFLTGRRNELINRGGDKIAPAEVDAVLLAHPVVSDAACFAVPDERFGEDIVAAVVLEPGQAASPRALRTWMLGHLAPHKVPRRIWFVDDLPRTLSTKVQRGELTRRWKADQK